MVLKTQGTVGINTPTTSTPMTYQRHINAIAVIVLLCTIKLCNGLQRELVFEHAIDSISGEVSVFHDIWLTSCALWVNVVIVVRGVFLTPVKQRDRSCSGVKGELLLLHRGAMASRDDWISTSYHRPKKGGFRCAKRLHVSTAICIHA